MSLNNPEINRGNAGNTVYIDPTAITEMPTQIMQQDLDPLVGLNLHPSDLESLHMTTDEQVECINDGNILPSSNSSVGDIVHVPDSAMDTSEAVGVNSMDSEVLPENVLNDIGLLTDSQDFIPIMSNEEVLDLKPPQQQSGLHLGMSPNQDVLSPSVEPTTDVSSVPGTHILKFNSGQFIVLQPNQNSQQVNLNNKSFSSSNLVFSSLPSNSVPKITKPTLVNSNQVLTNSILQNSTLNVKTTQAPQFRTLQLKQPISLSTSANSSSMTKVILTSQPGNNLSQQLRLISSQAPVSNATNVKNTLSSTVVSNPSKMTFQLQPIVLSMSSSKSGVNSPVKTEVVNPKPQTDIKMPLTIPLKSLNASIQQMTSLQSNEVTSNVYSQLDPKVSVASSSANQSVFIKPGNIFKTGTGLIKIPISQLQQLAGQNQSLGTQNKLNLRLIPTTVANSVPQTIKNVTTKPVLAPATSSNGRNPKTTVQFTHIHPKQQRVIIPANSASNSVIIPSNTNSAGNNPLQIRPQGSITLPASALNSSVFSNAQPGSLVMIPAQYFQNSNNNSSNNTPVSIQNVSKQVQSKTVIDANVIKPRKPCNCTKSQCLKLYCDCFANGEFCNNCNCVNCFNNLSHEEDRQKAIKCCLERNPQAFRPKIGKGGTDTERRHNKGCNCKRSGCLKNYCECYEAKIPCSNMCRCVGCRNMDSEQPFERKRLMALAEAAEARVHQHSAFKSRQISLSLPSPAKMSLPSSAKNSYCRISQEVVEATCHCLLAQAEKVEKGKMNSPQKMESMVLNEFSHCLLRIIGFNTKVKGSFS